MQKTKQPFTQARLITLVLFSIANTGFPIPSIQNPRTQRTGNFLQPFSQLPGFCAPMRVDINHDIADPGIGLQVLAGNIDLLFRKDSVNLG